MVIGYEDIVYIRKIIKSIPGVKSGEDLEKYTLKFKHIKSYENIIKKADILGITVYTYNKICVIPNVNSKEIVVINNANEKFETPVKANQLFSDLNIGTIDVTDIDFSRTVEAKDLFAYCSCKEILMAGANLSSAITLHSMCAHCKALVHIDLSDVNIEKVKDISYMFFECSDLQCISTKGIKTGNLRNMIAMFEKCKSLRKINLSPFDTSKVTEIFSICNGCERCEHIMLVNNNFDSLVDMSFAFKDCKKLRQVIFPNQELRQLKNMKSAFYNAENLELVSFDKAVISKDTNMWLLVYGCKSLCKVIFPSSILTKEQINDMAFNDRKNIITKDAKVIIDKGLVSYINVISSKYSAKNIVFKTVNSIDAFKKKAEVLNFKNVEFGMQSVNKKFIHSIEKICLYLVTETDNSNTLYIVAEQKFSITNGERLFRGELGNACAVVIENICLDDVDFSDVDVLQGCFSNMQQLRSISIKDKSFDNCTSITGMFSNCSKLRSVHLSNLKFPKVEFLIDIFKDCTHLENVELNNIELPLSKSAINTFANCGMLKEIDLSTVKLGRIDYLIETFSKCVRLENIKMSHNIDASGLKYLNRTFAYCSNLENINLTWVNWRNVESIKGIFNECKNLHNIELNSTNINTPKLTMIADAVNGCTKLRTRFLDILDTKHIID